MRETLSHKIKIMVTFLATKKISTGRWLEEFPRDFLGRLSMTWTALKTSKARWLNLTRFSLWSTCRDAIARMLLHWSRSSLILAKTLNNCKTTVCNRESDLKIMIMKMPMALTKMVKDSLRMIPKIITMKSEELNHLVLHQVLEFTLLVEAWVPTLTEPHLYQQWHWAGLKAMCQIK